MAVELTRAYLNWKVSCIDPCRVSHKEGDTAVPSEDRVGGSVIQRPVRDTRSLLPVLVNAAGKDTMQTWALSTAVFYSGMRNTALTDWHASHTTSAQGWEEPHI